jgi:4-hydroxy-3-polyprenylbenzoate decarboxylase
MHPVAPTGLMDKLKMLPMLAEVGGLFPKVVGKKDAPCKEVILHGDDVDVLKFPILQTWPGDGGRLLRCRAW